MTQTITALHQGFVLHASDRLLTLLDGDEYDVRSNKTIVVVTRRVGGVISYAGAANFAKCPTDEWLVRAVLGLGGDRRVPWPQSLDAQTAGEIADRLERELDELARFQARLRGQELIVQFTGYQGTPRGRTRPFAFTFRVGPGSVTSGRAFVRDQASTWRSGAFMISTPALVGSDRRRYVADVSFEIEQGGPPVQAVLTAMDRAARRHAVGERVLDVRIYPYPRRTAEIRLHKPSDQSDVVDLYPGKIDAAYTPWFITAAGANMPLMVTPGMEFDIGGANLTVKICETSGTVRDDRLLMAMVAVPQGRKATVSTERPPLKSDVFERHNRSEALPARLAEALRRCGLKSAGYVRFWPEQGAVTAVVETLPGDDGMRHWPSATEVLAAVGAPILLVSPDQRAMAFGNLDVDTTRKLAPLVFGEWKSAQDYPLVGRHRVRT